MDNWVKDEDRIECQICQSKFTTFKRRHHCRKCGEIFCADCSSNNLSINGSAQRACSKCFDQFQNDPNYSINKGSNSSKSHDSKYTKKPPPSSVILSTNQIDRNIILPKEYQNTRKDISACIRNTYDYKKDESIQPAINLHCDSNCIEKSIFGNLPPEEKEFTLRLYISYQLPKNFITGLVANILMKAGTNHLGVQICDKIVHWFDNSLVAVTEFSGEKALAIFPPYKGNEECLSIPNTEENRLKICKLVQKWNCTVTYSLSDNNCQKFASNLFETLGLNTDFKNGPFGEFIEHISKPNNTITKPCYVKGGRIEHTWENHFELDEWTEENNDFIVEHRSLFLLIKGFHRAYQARTIAHEKKEEKNEDPSVKRDDLGYGQCPMGNVTGLEIGIPKDKYDRNTSGTDPSSSNYSGYSQN
eukprot:TRINITY_DN3251_c0_g1_i1.p1 TRINITY_DN3251_c0_g1~~TRINITY_DN3251_c0_g1_i1.p1  ORF type:complete len:417 (+),score=92.91 TRINITY_DN3251_c0_g1_i1:30-1280(+)